MQVNEHPIEFQPPAISVWRQGNTGVDYVWSFDSGRPGPHVMVQALTHGNEWCGAIAVDSLLRAGVRPRQGRLSAAAQESMPSMSASSFTMSAENARMP